MMSTHSGEYLKITLHNIVKCIISMGINTDSKGKYVELGMNEEYQTEIGWVWCMKMRIGNNYRNLELCLSFFVW